MNDISTSEAIVRKFCETWGRRDLDGVLAMLSPDVDYQNVPAPAMIGRDAVREFIAPIIARTTAIEFIVLALAVSPDGRTVLTERVDKLHFGEKTIDIPLMGIFKIENGLIAEWRDYADSAPINAQFAELVS